MEKRRAHYRLAEIKSACADPQRLNRTWVARQGALDLDFDDDEVIAVIQGLTRRDLQKSMTSIANPAIWQDVYRPIWHGERLYVKFTLDSQGQFLLISFKRGDE
jgi:motility quorum-sensing regulator / GCU-specific mRNA interferase toxin